MTCPEQQFAKLDIVSKYQLDQRLDIVIDNHRRGPVCSEAERKELVPAAHA